MNKYAASILIAASIGACAEQTSQKDTLQAINQSVNQSMVYKRDAVSQWNADCPATGDCEDNALCKARKLITNGIASSRLKLLVCERETDYHAVLMVDNKHILDNLTPNQWNIKEEYCKPIYTCNLDNGETEFMGHSLGTRLNRCVQAAKDLRNNPR